MAVFRARAEAILNGRERIIVDGRQLGEMACLLHLLRYSYHLLIDILNFADKCETGDFSAGAVAGITFTITLLVVLPVGVVIGLGVAWWVATNENPQQKTEQQKKPEEPVETVVPLSDNLAHGQVPTSEGPQQKTEQQLQGTIYEEPEETAIPLSDNLAYGHIQRKN